MSIDREFRFLNQSKISLNDGKNTRSSVNKGDNKPSKVANFIKTSTLKYLIPALMLGAGGIEICKDKGSDGIHDERSMAIDMENNYLNIKDNTSEVNLTNYLLDVLDDNLLNDSCLALYDKNYDKNYVSGIPLDEEYNYAPGTHMAGDNKENLYLTMYRKLGYKEYESMFKGLKSLKQGNLGNCYFVIVLKTLARSRYFDTLMMTSIDKIGDDSFNLYMPLGEPGGLRVPITGEDLKAASINGPIGYKILEVGFAKYLLFKKGVIPNTDIIMTDELMKKMEAGSPGNAMISLLGPKSFVNKCIEKKNPNRVGAIMNGLKNFDPKNLGIIFAGSKYKEGETDRNYYEVGGERIYYGHAYSVCGIEKDGDDIKTVVLNNPWNNEKILGGGKIRLSISDFIDNFHIVNVGHITDNFLNLNTIEEETEIIDKIDRK